MTSTFTRRRTPHSLRRQFLMDAQAKLDIGQRIKDLRDNGPETNRSIAEAVGVGQRSVASWIAGGGITYDNAKKVSELFGKDVDYIWRGREKPAETPDLMGVLTGRDAPADLERVPAREDHDAMRRLQGALEHPHLDVVEVVGAGGAEDREPHGLARPRVGIAGTRGDDPGNLLVGERNLQGHARSAGVPVR